MERLGEVLELAADKLDVPGGWCQGKAHVYEHGSSEYRVVSSCLVGALELAAMELRVASGIKTARLLDAAAIAMVDAGVIPYSHAHIIGLVRNPGGLAVGWNDSPYRKQSDVVDGLKTTAKFLANNQEVT